MQFTTNVFNYSEPYVLDVFSVDVELVIDGILRYYHFRITVVRGLIVDLKCHWFLACKKYTPAGIPSDQLAFKAPFVEVIPLPSWYDEGRVWACPSDIDSVDEIVKLAKKMCVGRTK